MAVPQFETREELEAYLSRPQPAPDKSTPMWLVVTSALLVPLVLGLWFNGTQPGQNSAKAMQQRQSTLLSWLGVDVDEWNRQQKKQLDQIMNARYDSTQDQKFAEVMRQQNRKMLDRWNRVENRARIQEMGRR